MYKYGQSRNESQNAAIPDGHSDISITMNVYTHLGLDDAKEEMIRMQELNMAREELRKEAKIQPISQKEFRVV